jgi:O-antigen/teichoic acid export membrane protein
VLFQPWFEVCSDGPLRVENENFRQPAIGRDAGWLLSAEIVAVFLAFIGQIILTRELLAEEYGWLVLAIDIYASIFLIADLGLPTLLARDGAGSPQGVRSAVGRIYQFQGIAFVCFLSIALLLQPLNWFGNDAPQYLAIICIFIAFIHIASYAPRASLRAIGSANHEAISKVIERVIIVCGYLLLANSGDTSVISYALMFFIGGLCSVLYSLFVLHNLTKGHAYRTSSTSLGKDWASNKILFFSALPFAVTLSVLPYVIRIEKFIIAHVSSVEVMAVFHVAQLAWLAGLVVPAALRAALLPVLGQQREAPIMQHGYMHLSLDICFGLLPIGLFSGHFIVSYLAPIAFPSEYLDGSLGANAVDLFTILLFGWAATLMSTPTYTRLQTHQNPWRFTLFIAIVVFTALIVGWVLVGILSSTDKEALYYGAIAASISSVLLCLYSIHLSGSWAWFLQRKDDWILATMGVGCIILGLLSSTPIWVFGLPLFLFIPKAVQAVKTTLS